MGDENGSEQAVREILSTVTKKYHPNIAIERVHPNPWNPNQQDERTYQATRESIREYGFIDPVTCWPHPEIADDFMAIDGEHRVSAASDEGLKKVDLMVLHGLTPPQARKLTIILNETRGDPDVALLGKLLAEIDEMMDHNTDLLSAALPYNGAELQHLLEVGRTDWDEFSQQASHRMSTTTSGHSVKLEFEDAQYERWQTFTGMLEQEAGDDEEFSVEEALLSVLAVHCKQL